MSKGTLTFLLNSFYRKLSNCESLKRMYKAMSGYWLILIGDH